MSTNLEDRVRNALHDAGRTAGAGPAGPDAAMIADAYADAYGRRRRRSAIGGVVAASLLVGVAAAFVWPRDAARPISVDPAQFPQASAPPTTATPASTVSPAQPGATVETGAPEVSVDTTAPVAPVAAVATGLAAPIAVGNLLAVRADGTLVEVSPQAQTETVRGMLSFAPASPEMALGPDRQTVYALRGARTGADRFDVVQLRADGTETVLVDDVTAFALSPDGRHLAAGYAPRQTGNGTARPSHIIERTLTDEGAIDRNLTGTVRIWDHPGYRQERVTSLAYSPDGQKLAYVALFETGAIRTFAVDGTPPADALTVQTGTANSFTDIGWDSDATLTAVNRCCGVESTQTPELVMMRPDGQVVAKRSQPATDISLATGGRGWTAIIGPTLVLQSSEETRSFGAYVAATF